jgi:hypothetical protein
MCDPKAVRLLYASVAMLLICCRKVGVQTEIKRFFKLILNGFNL